MPHPEGKICLMLNFDNFVPCTNFMKSTTGSAGTLQLNVMITELHLTKKVRFLLEFGTSTQISVNDNIFFSLFLTKNVGFS